MLKEFVTVTAFFIVLAGIAESVVLVQKNAEKDLYRVERIMEKANETD